jgi:uncharacterized protein YkwD
MGLFDWLRRKPKPKPVPPPVVVPGDTTMASLYAALNDFRATYNRSALSHDARVVQIAQIHSQTMAASGKMFHGDYWDRLQKNFPGQVMGASENVGWNYPSSQAAVTGWINSPGHRDNLLGNWTTCGAWMARNQYTGMPYWCIVFVRLTEQ